jgi:hypothetical protein
MITNLLVKQCYTDETYGVDSFHDWSNATVRYQNNVGVDSFHNYNNGMCVPAFFSLVPLPIFLEQMCLCPLLHSPKILAVHVRAPIISLAISAVAHASSHRTVKDNRYTLSLNNYHSLI